MHATIIIKEEFMSKYYGSCYAINGNTTVAGRRGYEGIRSAAQTWEGSLIAIAKDKTYKSEETIFELEVSDDSSMYGETIFTGTLEELKARLKGDTNA